MFLQRFHTGKQVGLRFFRRLEQPLVGLRTGDKIGVADVPPYQQRIDPAVQNILIRCGVFIKQYVVFTLDIEHHKQTDQDQNYGNSNRNTIAKQQTISCFHIFEHNSFLLKNYYSIYLFTILKTIIAIGKAKARRIMVIQATILNIIHPLNLTLYFFFSFS